MLCKILKESLCFLQAFHPFDCSFASLFLDWTVLPPLPFFLSDLSLYKWTFDLLLNLLKYSSMNTYRNKTRIWIWEIVTLFFCSHVSIFCCNHWQDVYNLYLVLSEFMKYLVVMGWWWFLVDFQDMKYKEVYS